MARIVDYDTVLQTLLGQGLKSLYYNSGSFGFPPGVTTHTLGWVGPPDPTIRPEALAVAKQIPQPHVQNLTALALRAWRECAPGVIWVMPRSHWAYELDFGSREWMPAALASVGIDGKELEPLTTGAAIEFQPEQADEFRGFLSSLLENLSGSSDFQLAWPSRPLVCTVHHHKQLWWTTPDDALHRAIAAMA